MNDVIISAKNLYYAYPTEDGNAKCEENAVSGLSVDIPRGKFTCIIGHNGSGKSTLAKLLSGIIVPDSGTVTVFKSGSNDGLESGDEKNNFEIRKTVGMVFQNPDNQLVATIVEDDVAFAPENLGIAPEEIRKRVDDALEAVGLSEYATHDTHKLSGGQKQRVAIAGMLAMSPECIIFDESTAMLDPRGREDILNTIVSLRDKGMTVVLITHYMNEAALADNIILVDKGTAMFSGTPEEVFAERKLLEESRLEAPQALSLVQMLKEAGVQVETKGVLNAHDAALAIKAALDNLGNSKNV